MLKGLKESKIIINKQSNLVGKCQLYILTIQPNGKFKIKMGNTKRKFTG